MSAGTQNQLERGRSMQARGFSCFSLLLLATASAHHDDIVWSVKLVRFVTCRSADNLDPPFVEVERQISRARRHLDTYDHLSCDSAVNILFRVIRRWETKLMPVIH